MEDNFKSFNAQIPMVYINTIKKLAFYENCSCKEALEYFVYLGITALENDDWVMLETGDIKKFTRGKRSIDIPNCKVDIIEFLKGEMNCFLSDVFAYLLKNGIEYAKSRGYKIFKNKNGVEV